MTKPKTARAGSKSAPKSRTATKTSDPSATDAQNASPAPTGEPDAPATDAKTGTAKTDAKPPKKAKAPKEELVVFAFRLTPAERDLIHKASGPAKASRFVRALCVHASAGDVDTVKRMVEAGRGDAQ